MRRNIFASYTGEQEEEGADPIRISFSRPQQQLQPQHQQGDVDDDWIQLREQAKADALEKRRRKRRRKAHGSVCRYYCSTRLQLLLLLQPRNLLLFVVGAVGWVGVWVFLVYGQPVNPASPHWQGITANESTSTWGGQLTEVDWLCETIRYGEFVRQPSNALSTVSYALVGWLVLCLWVLDVNRQSSFESRFGNLPASVLLRKCSWSALLGASLFYMAVGAFLRHATTSETGKRLETSGYWTLLFCLTTCSLTRLVDAPRKLRNETRQILSATLTFVMIFATVGVDVWFGIRLELLGAPMIPEIVFGTLAGMSLLCMGLGVAINFASVESEVWWVWFGLGAFVIGYLLAKYDAEKMSCQLQGHDSFYQSYALWHLFCSLSVLCFYLYLRSELWRRGDGAEFAPRIRPLHKLYRLWLFMVQYSQELVREEQQPPQATRRVIGEEEVEEKQEEQPRTSAGGFNMIQLKFAQVICGLGITGAIIYVVFLAFSDPK